MKQFSKLLASLALLTLLLAFVGCSNSSSSDNNSGDSTDTNETITFAGTYAGAITGNNTTLYITVIATETNYTTKMWTSSAKSGDPNQTVTGTYTVTGNTINCTGNDHTMTGTTTDDGATWSISVSTGFTGTITKQ